MAAIKFGAECAGAGGLFITTKPDWRRQRMRCAAVIFNIISPDVEACLGPLKA